MSGEVSISRRQFAAGATGFVGVAAGLQAGALNAGHGRSAGGRAKLAIEGGPKTVTARPKARPRWGEPELERLRKLIQQDSLFYWQAGGYGPQSKLVIERYRQFHPARWVHTCSSGTAAIHIALGAAGIGWGDEVITTPITDMGTVIGIIYQQAVPVFADLCEGTYNLDPADVERRITPRTKAIIAVHLCGNPCQLDELKAIADKHKLILIEDSCQACAAKYRGRPVGSIGHFNCHSFQDSKQITCGDGGLVACDDDRFGPLLQMYGDKGFSRTQRVRSHVAFATNYRMSEVQAAVAAAQLARMEGIVAKRDRLGKLLSEKLAGTPGIIPHKIHPEDRCSFYFYMFQIRPEAFRCDRQQLVHAMRAEGAPVSAGYIPRPLYKEEVFQQHAFFAGRWPVKEVGLTKMDFTKHCCPTAEKILATGIRTWICEYHTEEYIVQVAEAIRKVAEYYAV